MHIKTKHARGVYQKDIATDLGVSPRTVSRALKRGSASIGRRPQAKSSMLDPFKPMIDELLADDVWNAMVILEVIRERGYTGGETLDEVARRHGKTPAQVLIRWNLQQGFVPIPKANRLPHLEENLDVFGFELGAEEIEELNGLNQGYSSLGRLPYLSKRHL